MNVAGQRRKITQLITDAPDSAHVAYLEHVLALFDAAVARGRPRPAVEFRGMYCEEFDVSDPS
jgi:hypothetical protein